MARVVSEEDALVLSLDRFVFFLLSSFHFLLFRESFYVDRFS